MIGKMVISKAGHDKDEIYFVLSVDKNMALVTDGKYKTIEKPKKKNIKHLQIINKETEVGRKIVNSEKIINEEVKRQIKLYKAEIKAKN